MRPWIAVLVAAVTTLGLVEFGTCALVETGLLSAPRPRDKKQEYWRGDHPEFGVWHAPGLSYEHKTSCYHVTYRANSVGARDVERTRRSDRPRVVVLGDSFFEGWGVSESERLSNLLEKQTGIEHLNFAMSHFGPYQEYLVYRSLARDFDHEAVIVGILPANDLLEVDFEASRKLAYYRFRYRPYLVGEEPDLQHLHHREPRWRRWLRYRSYAGNALITAAERRARAQGHADVAESGQQTRFCEHEERQVRLLEAILERLTAEARGKRVAVVLVPTLFDLHSYARRGCDPLSTRLREAGERSGYRVVNLLPAMTAATKEWSRYFSPCDYHWSGFGNAVAVRIVLETLGPEFFGLHAP
jgi:hypothetical protein